MPDPLLGDAAFSVERSPAERELELVGTAPGPAGHVEVAVGAGVMVALDVAVPGEVVGVVVPLAGATTAEPDADRVARRLLGESVLAEALAVPTDGGIHRLGGTADRDLDPTLARFVLAASGADAPGLLPDERALAVLDAAALAGELDLPFDGWRDRLHDAASVVVARAVAIDDDLDGDARALASSACHLASSHLDDDLLAARLARVAEVLRADAPARWTAFRGRAVLRSESRMAAPSDAAGAAVPLPAAAAPTGRGRPRPLPEVAADALSTLVSGAVPTVRHTSGDEFELRLDGWAGRTEGWWVRVVHEADRVPLAAVPLTAGGSAACARFLLAARRADEVIVDVVDDHDAPYTGRSVAAFRAGVASGRRAARLERLGRSVDASAAWRAAAALHDRAGHQRAAAAALELADDQLRVNRNRRGSVAAVLVDWLGPPL